MKMITDAWFEFNGVRSTDMGVRLMALPKRPIAAEKGEKISVPGRDGYLWMSEGGAREAIIVNVSCTTVDGYNPNGLAKWLSGEGLLIFSDDPKSAYRARVISEYAREYRFLRFDAEKFDIPFECQPYRYVYPDPSRIKLTASQVVDNPGNVYSLPKITVNGGGEITLHVGDYMIDIEGGSVVIDSETMECFDTAGRLANDRVSMDEFPRLLPGDNPVMWSGNVTSVLIDGRWRNL